MDTRPDIPFQFFPDQSHKKSSRKKKAAVSVARRAEKSRFSLFVKKAKQQKSKSKTELASSPDNSPQVSSVSSRFLQGPEVDHNKRTFLKVASVAGAGLLASQLIPKKAEALIMGSTPSSSVVGIKDASNVRIDPALKTGQGVTKLTTSLAASGTVRTPASGKKIRVYATRFSLTADATSVSFRFTSGGTDYEKYVTPKTGGLYGSNNHPNYVEGGVDEVLYCNISGTTTVQINIDYLEV